MIGDQNDQVGRLKRLLPRWFGDVVPVLDALLAGYGYVQAFLFDLISYARLQTRVLTATGGWLDLISADFFGATLPRATGQSDASFRTAIIINLFRPRGTRAAVISILESLTGHAPVIFEPFRVADAGAYGAPLSGYGVAGRYGSASLPYQAFVTAFRPTGSGNPLVAGYGVPTGAYRTPSRAEYVALLDSANGITDSDIYAAIDSVKVAGTIIWTRITNYAPSSDGSPPRPGYIPTLDSTIVTIDTDLLTLDMT